MRKGKESHGLPLQVPFQKVFSVERPFAAVHRANISRLVVTQLVSSNERRTVSKGPFFLSKSFIQGSVAHRRCSARVKV